MKKKDLLVKLLYLVLLLPFFKTDFIARYTEISNLFNILKIISIVIITIMFVRKGKINENLMFIGLFCLWPIFITFIKGDNFNLCFNLYGMILILSLMFEVKNNDIRFIEALLFCFEIVIYINFITMIIWPNGLYTTGNEEVGIATGNWFLGFKNVMIAYFLPAYITSYLYKNISGKKIRNNILVMVICISAILSKSSTSIVGIITLCIFSNCKFFNRKGNIFNIKNYIIIYIIIFILIVIFRTQNMFSFLIVDILHKDLTFTNRTVLWDITLDKIKQSPILGYGCQNNNIRHFMYNSETIITAHNQFLEFIYTGGIIMFGIYIMMIFKFGKKLKGFYDDKNIQIISLGFLIFQIINLTEVYFNPLIYLVLIYLAYAKKFSLKENDNNVINYNSGI
mgnify:CR=1 FL=1